VEYTSFLSSVADANIKDEAVLITSLPACLFLGVSHIQEVSETEGIGNGSEQR